MSSIPFVAISVTHPVIFASIFVNRFAVPLSGSNMNRQRLVSWIVLALLAACGDDAGLPGSADPGTTGDGSGPELATSAATDPAPSTSGGSSSGGDKSTDTEAHTGTDTDPDTGNADGSTGAPTTTGDDSDGTVLWNADWEVTGATKAAVFDLEQAQPFTVAWGDIDADTPSGVRVVEAAAAACDYSAVANAPANVLQTEAPNGDGVMAFGPGAGYLPPVQAGESRYYRMLICHPGGAGTHTLHDISDNGMDEQAFSWSGNANLSWGIEDPPGAWSLTLIHMDIGIAEPAGNFSSNASLDYGVPYWLEWGVDVVSVEPPVLRAHARVWAANTSELILDDQDFVNWSDPDLTLADGTTFAGINPLDSLQGVALGGANGFRGGAGVHHEYGAYAICADQWCGIDYPLPGED